MKYGIMFFASLTLLILAAGSLVEETGSVVVNVIIIVASIAGCIYSEYKLGWLEEFYGEE